MSDKNPAPILVPGQSIGPIRLGMTLDELSRLGLQVRSHPSGQMGGNVRLVGPYQVVLAGERVISVAFILTGSRTGIVIGGRLFGEGVSATELARALPDCSAPDLREGGTVIKCGAGTLVKVGLEEPAVVELQVISQD